MKICSKCKIEKSIYSFQRNKKQKDGRQNYCKECFKPIKKQQYQRYKDKYKVRCQKLRLRNRQFIFDYFKTHPCVDCGISNPIVLTFDHVLGSKKYEISRLKSSSRSIELIEEEIAKCEVRCFNCHACRTAKQFDWYKDLK